MLQDIEKMKVQYLMNLLFDLFEILQAVFKFYLKQVKDISKCWLCTAVYISWHIKNPWFKDGSFDLMELN